VSDDDELTIREVKELLVFGRVVQPVPKPPREPAARNVTEAQIRQAIDDLRSQTGSMPKQPAVAKKLGIDVRTLRRAKKDLGMGHWSTVAAASRR
jgi:hypothetical protein